MIRKSVRSAAAMAVALLVAAPAFAAEDFYVRVPGIDGDGSGPRGYEKWIPVTAFSLGFSRGVCSSFVLTKQVDVASPPLTMAAMLGTTYATVDAVVLANGMYDSQPQKLRLKLFGAVITSLEQSGSQTDAIALRETVRIQPERVEMTYFQQTATGSSVGLTSTVDCQKVK
jgi:type VI protein secretion system component Hcp